MSSSTFTKTAVEIVENRMLNMAVARVLRSNELTTSTLARTSSPAAPETWECSLSALVPASTSQAVIDQRPLLLNKMNQTPVTNGLP
jgi:hypothetical protein